MTGKVVGTIAVIGGGFSGVLTASHLLRRPGIRVVLIEPQALVGRGRAYAASAREFLLNVPAASMSAWPDRPNHFLAWLRRREPTADGLTFAPRALYGDYVADLLRRSRAGALNVVRDEVRDIERHADQYMIGLASGGVIRCRSVILALGHAPPRPLHNLSSPAQPPTRVIQDPLADLQALAPNPADTVAIVGTGLTALDVMTSLRSRGHRGRICAISRRGLIPHVQVWPVPAALPRVPDEIRRRPTVRRLVRWLKDVGRELSARGLPAVRAVDALRPYTAELWRRMTAAERARFCRHASAFWGVCRHRAASGSYSALSEGCAEGRIEIIAARCLGYEAIDTGHVRLRIQRRAHALPSTLTVNWLVNCTGPDQDVTRHPSPLVQSMLRKRMLQPDSLALGVLTTAEGELIGTDGKVVRGVHVVGPWRAATEWESTAVPELRVQAAAVAASVAASFDRERIAL